MPYLIYSARGVCRNPVHFLVPYTNKPKYQGLNRIDTGVHVCTYSVDSYYVTNDRIGEGSATQNIPAC
jgi:hypothetical protein